MGDEDSRRGFLRRGLTVAGFGPLTVRSAASTRELSNESTLEVVSEGGGVAGYEFTVSGSLRQEDWDDEVAGSRASGHVGPERGTDTFSYSGRLTHLALAGPARVLRDGYRLRPEVFSAPDGVLTAADVPARSGAKRLRIESQGGGFGVYEFQTNGTVRQLDADDEVSGDRAYGHVGPKRGTDEFRFTGDVTRLVVVGPASASLDGEELLVGRTEPSISRASPEGTLSVRPETTVLFEALARGHRASYPPVAWYVDGRRRVGPDAFYGGLSTGSRSTFTHSFDSTGTHRVRAELYEEGETHDEDAEPLGAVAWTVEVGSDGNRPPTVTRVRPKAETLDASRDSPEPVEFEVVAEDPEGRLDRVVWWLSQCDAVMGVSPVEGGRDTATFSFPPNPGCPVAAWGIDERGAMASSDPWLVKPKGN